LAASELRCSFLCFSSFFSDMGARSACRF
jgi:hypothetical protein